MTDISNDFQWKEIPGFNGYEAHPDGEIRNKKTKRIFLAESKGQQYRKIISNKKSICIHRMIALTFHPNPLDLPQVHHKDANKRNNKAENLDGTRIKYWESCQEAENKIPNISVRSIFTSIKSDGNTLAGSYLWQKASYEDIINPQLDYIKCIPKRIRIALNIPEKLNVSLKPGVVKLLRKNISINGDFTIKTMPIVQLSLNDEIIKYWSSPEKARVKLGYKRNQIEKVLKVINNTLNGYKWRRMTIEELCDFI